MTELMSKYVPMMGINTQMVDLVPCKTCDDVKMLAKKEEGLNDIYVNELAREILLTPELALFYIQLKSKLNIPEIFERIEKEGDFVEPCIQKIVTDVVGYQLDTIDRAIAVNKKLLREMGDV